MNRSEFGNLFNRIMEDLERLEAPMPETSKERRHVGVAKGELMAMAEWLGFRILSKQEYEELRKKNPTKLRSVK